jgi:alpha-L-arabinofuranosidase
MADPGREFSPDMYGIFFEDINHASDGGLYAELIRNRDFENNRVPEDMHWLNDSTIANSPGWTEKYIRPGELEFWSLVQEGGARAGMYLEREHPLNGNNYQSMRFVISSLGNGRAAVANDGYWGISLKKGASYRLSLYARGDKDFNGTLTATLESRSGQVYSSQKIAGIGSSWEQFHVVLTAGAGDPNARLVIAAGSIGTVWLDMVSLFPEETWNNRPNGLRKDLVQKLADLNPSFFRFPGGCVVEGATLENRIQWKRTIGDVATRSGHWNLWGYRATDGLGFHEFLQLCEDLQVAPLYVINAGMSCQGRGGMVAAKTEIREYLRDALDALEYAMGPVTSKWGAMRLANGHPEPFRIKYLEIGNENCGPDYRDAYRIISAGIREKFPEIVIIANDMFSLTDQERKLLPGLKADLTDEHFYASPEYFYEQSARYDSFNRSNPWKVYIGEFAVTAGKPGTGNLRAALGEAAFIIGMERNADVVRMASYAPTFVNVNDRKWTVDMIAYNGEQAIGTPSYEAIKLFSNNRPARVVPAEVLFKTDPAVEPWSNLAGGIALRVWNGSSEFKDLQVVSDGKILFSEDFRNGLEKWRFEENDWKISGGVLLNTTTDQEVKISAGNADWLEYTLSLKARKISGSEGLFIDFLVNGKNRCTWNLGAWNNVADLLWQDRNDTRVDAGRYLERSLESGRWYDIRIEVENHRVRCWLDGALIRDELLKGDFTPSIYATAGISKNRDELILKIVNPFPEKKQCNIELLESPELLSDGRAIILTSGSLDDENTFAEPEKISPQEITLKGVGKTFAYPCPPNSLSILRLKIQR